MKPIALVPAIASLALGACATLLGSTSPFAFDKKGELVEFEYGWSAEASRQPALVRRLRADLDQSFKAVSATAETDRAAALASGRSFHGHRYSRRWTTAGQSARLLSLDGRLLTSTGGDSVTRADGLLWDRTAKVPVTLSQIFIADTMAASLRAPACAAIGRELVRRQGSLPACAAPDALAIIPADANGNRRFDHFRLVAPSRANPPGQYVLASLPVSAATLAALKPAYRAGFEVGQPQ